MKAARWGTLALAATLVAFSIGDKERGNRLYRAGKYAEAAAAYAQALKAGDDSPELHYNYGTALLQLGRYDEAEQHLKAALRNVEPTLREKTLYNLGNRYLYAARGQTGAASQAAAGAGGAPGGAAGASPGADTKPLLDGAIKAYEQALRIDPRDGFAKWNLELALKQQKPPAGGGGARQNKGGGGGGGGQRKNPAQGQANENNPTPRSQMNQAEADRILSAAENDERQLYKEKVRKGNREVPVSRDW